jgi:hypothetical protein
VVDDAVLAPEPLEIVPKALQIHRSRMRLTNKR